METAYIIFDGKYSMTDIKNMPYKTLITLIENESKNSSKELEEMKAAQKQKKEMAMLAGTQMR